ncbi:peptidoglycan-binding protein [Methylobacterium sp. J-090]|nr:peptidoglycan-binding domain-containing protein [Methylobacterium sp. J-090]MCJ2081454.1 peptidoglycan-binding protein [Methylobacterium sp. J-090]
MIVALLAAPIPWPMQALSQSPPAPRPKSPPPSPGKPAAPDPAFEAAKAAFEALPETERKGLQDALVWTGDFNGVVTGTFGKRTHDALTAYQKRAGGAGTGPLDAPGRSALLKAGAAARNAVGFAVRPDPASGTVLGLPERRLPKRGPIPGGTRWQSADGRITVEAKSFPPGETSLEAVFARITAPSPERRVTYKLQRPDFLVVTAETATGKSYIRYAAGEMGVRGLTLGYDKALSETFDRLVIAIANSFVPFPDAAPAAPAVPVARAAPTPPLPADRPAAPHATGLVVGPGRVLTSAAAFDKCASPRIDGQAARIAVRDTDLILLDSTGLTKSGFFPPLRPEAATPAEAMLVLSAEAGGAVTAAPSALAQDGRITAPLQPGAGGAPILDPAGALVGLVSVYPTAPRRVAGVVPPARYGTVAGARIGQFLTAAGMAVPAADATAARLADAIVGIACQP